MLNLKALFAGQSGIGHAKIKGIINANMAIYGGQYIGNYGACYINKRKKLLSKGQSAYLIIYKQGKAMGRGGNIYYALAPCKGANFKPIFLLGACCFSLGQRGKGAMPISLILANGNLAPAGHKIICNCCNAASNMQWAMPTGPYIAPPAQPCIIMAKASPAQLAAYKAALNLWHINSGPINAANGW